jgi:hypothetical protein
MRRRPNKIADADPVNRSFPSALLNASVEQLTRPASGDFFIVGDLPHGAPPVRNFVRSELRVANKVRICGHLLKIEDPRETPSMIGTLIMRNLPVREIHRTR